MRVTSTDGTRIAYERAGSGPAVILVGGGLDDGSENAPLAPALAERFTVYNYARRGRGESGDTLPYAVEREIDDIDALIAEAGGSAHLYGVSSGGALALEAGAAGLAVDRIAVYEVPYLVADDMGEQWREYVDQLRLALAAGRRGDAIELFMRVAGSSEEGIASARSSPALARRRGPGAHARLRRRLPGRRPPAGRPARAAGPADAGGDGRKRRLLRTSRRRDRSEHPRRRNA